MRFVEKTESELQVIVHYLKKSADGPEFVLFPMIHLGSEEFYGEIARRLEDCDVILAEGINSRRGRLLTLPYRIAAKSWRIRLQVQDKALNLSRFKDRIIKSDLDLASFEEGWSSLSLRIRAYFLFAMPLATFYMFFLCNRESLAGRMLGKRQSSHSSARDDDVEQFARLLGGERNRVLMEHIRRLHKTSKKQNVRIAIPYGAKHMSRITKCLLGQLGYRVIRKELLTVFEF